MQTFFGSVKKPAFAKPPSGRFGVLRATPKAFASRRRGRCSASQHDLFRYANVLGLREKS